MNVFIKSYNYSNKAFPSKNHAHFSNLQNYLRGTAAETEVILVLVACQIKR